MDCGITLALDSNAHVSLPPFVVKAEQLAKGVTGADNSAAAALTAAKMASMVEEDEDAIPGRLCLSHAHYSWPQPSLYPLLNRISLSTKG